MLRTDFTKIGTLPLWVLSLFVSMLFMGTNVHAENNPTALGSLACNNSVNASVNANCEVNITLAMVLEGEDPTLILEDHYVLEIEDFPVNDGTVDGYAAGTITLSEKREYIASVRETGVANPNSCWGTVTVEDKIDPLLVSNSCGDPDSPCILWISCEEISELSSIEFLDANPGLIPVPQVADNCTAFDALERSVHVSVLNDGNCDDKSLEVDFTYEDLCGNTTTVTSYYLVPTIDVTSLAGPLTEAPVGEDGKVYLPCGSDTDPESVRAHAYDLLLEYFLSFYGPEPTAAQIAEAEGSAAYYDDLFAYPHAFYDGFHNFYKPLNHDVCNTATVYTDVFVPICDADACPGMGKHIRTWTVYDWCSGESQDFSQVIINADQDGPNMDAEDVVVSVDPWDCWGNVVFPEPHHLNDKCGDYTSWSVVDHYGQEVDYDADLGWVVWQLPKGIHHYTYVGRDCCGNTTNVDVVVTVQDNTPPVAVSKQDIVISLTSGPGGNGIAKLFKWNVDNGSFDGCSDVHLEIRRENDFCDIDNNLTYNNDGHPFDDADDDDEGEFVKFCCQDLVDNGVDENGDGYLDYAMIKVWLRVWDDGDMDGVFGTEGDNYNETWSYVRLEDKLTPVITCPPDIEIGCEEDCDDLNLVGTATAFASCSDLLTDYKDLERNIDGCGDGYVLRQWYVVSRPDITCQQMITKLGTNSTDITIYWPEDAEIDCTDEEVYDHPWWDAGACDQMAYNLDTDTFYFEEGACYKVLNHWTVINWCHYVPGSPDIPGFDDGYDHHTQVIKIQDFQKPVLTGCDEMLMLEADDIDDVDGDGVICEHVNPMFTMEAIDEGECPSNWIKWVVQVDLWGDWTVDHEFRTDYGPLHANYIEPTQPGEEVKITLPEDIAGSMITHRIIWKASDGCGNVTTCTQELMVVDKLKPTPYCVNLSSALMENGEVALWACDFNLGSYDNCTAQEDLRYTFSSTPPEEDEDYIGSLKCSAMTFNCDDFNAASENGGLVSVDMYVWDEKGQYDYCTVTLTLVDNSGFCDPTNGVSRMIAGYVATENGDVMEDVEITIDNNTIDYPLSIMTDGDGYYAFDENIVNNDYMIQGAKNDDYKNGVSTVDIVLIQKHILGLGNLDSAYKILAADATGDEKISAQDLLTIRQLVLGVITEFPNTGSWMFVDADKTLDYPSPWPLDDHLMVESLASDMMHEDFIAVKIGDVNNTVILSAKDESDTRSAEMISLQVDDRMVNTGDLVNIQVNADEIEELFGMQFTLQHDGLTLVNIEGRNLDVNQGNYASLADNLTTFSWNTSQKIDASGALFNLTFSANTTASLSSLLSITSDVTSAEAYTTNAYEMNDLELVFGESSTGVFALFQNVPNPAKNNTNISFVLPEAGQASLSIYSITGQVVKQIDAFYAKGKHTITVDADDIPSAGMWFYTLESNNNSATKRMMIID